MYYHIDIDYCFVLVDDPLETTAVHFGGGLWGVVAMPLFTKGGFWNNPDPMPVSLWINLKINLWNYRII